MSNGPFIFIDTLTVKDGTVDDHIEDFEKVAAVVQEHEPRIIAFNIYTDETRKRMTMVQVHPDAASMGFHMSVVSEHLGGLINYLDGESTIICGPDADGVVDQIKQWTEPHVALSHMQSHVVGFTRAEMS